MQALAAPASAFSARTSTAGQSGAHALRGGMAVRPQPPPTAAPGMMAQPQAQPLSLQQVINLVASQPPQERGRTVAMLRNMCAGPGAADPSVAMLLQLLSQPTSGPPDGPAVPQAAALLQGPADPAGGGGAGTSSGVHGGARAAAGADASGPITAHQLLAGLAAPQGGAVAGLQPLSPAGHDYTSMSTTSAESQYDAALTQSELQVVHALQALSDMAHDQSAAARGVLPGQLSAALAPAGPARASGNGSPAAKRQCTHLSKQGTACGAPQQGPERSRQPATPAAARASISGGVAPRALAPAPSAPAAGALPIASQSTSSERTASKPPLGSGDQPDSDLLAYSRYAARVQASGLPRPALPPLPQQEGQCASSPLPPAEQTEQRQNLLKALPLTGPLAQLRPMIETALSHDSAPVPAQHATGGAAATAGAQPRHHANSAGPPSAALSTGTPGAGMSAQQLDALVALALQQSAYQQPQSQVQVAAQQQPSMLSGLLSPPAHMPSQGQSAPQQPPAHAQPPSPAAKAPADAPAASDQSAMMQLLQLARQHAAATSQAASAASLPARTAGGLHDGHAPTHGFRSPSQQMPPPTQQQQPPRTASALATLSQQIEASATPSHLASPSGSGVQRLSAQQLLAPPPPPQAAQAPATAPAPMPMPLLAGTAAQGPGPTHVPPHLLQGLLSALQPPAGEQGSTDWRESIASLLAKQAPQ